MSNFNPKDDLDPIETSEWLESIDSVLTQHGPDRAHYLLDRMIDFARRSGAYLPYSPNTAYLNTISPGRQPEYPGDRALERRIEAYIRWNAMAMVVQANRESTEYGGHLASYASSATMYEVGLLGFVCGANPTRIRFLPPPAITTNDHIDAALSLLEESLAIFAKQHG